MVLLYIFGVTEQKGDNSEANSGNLWGVLGVGEEERG